MDFVKLADKIESTLKKGEHSLEQFFRDDLLSKFESSEEYWNYTKAPPGNKTVKKVQHWYDARRGIPKTSYQEFRFKHLQFADTRKKYGEKFLLRWKAVQGDAIRDYDWRNLMESLKEVPDTPDQDPVYLELLDYYLTPLFDDDDFRHRLSAPDSGFPIFQAFMNEYERGAYSKIPVFFEMSQIFRKIRKDSKNGGGNIAAVKFFRDEFFPNGIPEHIKRDDEFLKSDIFEPLREIFLQVKDVDEHGWELAVARQEHQATTKSVRSLHKRAAPAARAAPTRAVPSDVIWV